MQEMIKVRNNSSHNHLNEEKIVKSVMPEHRNDDKTAYQSPTLIIQQEVNELALQKEGNKIKQKINHRKQANICGEPEDQKNIRVNVAIERVKGEIELLRLRSQNNQQKVINADKEMDDDLKRKAKGRTLEMLQNMWKSECEKEEKKSLVKWR